MSADFMGGKEANSRPSDIKLWSQAQEDAFDLLFEMSDVFFAGGWTSTGLRPRLDPLIVGATGLGKSHLVRSLAKARELPILRLSYGEWLVTGSKEQPHTLARVRDFVKDHNRGLIHLDELDKFRSTLRTDWSMAVFGEVFHLLDRSLEQPLRFAEWTPLLKSKLKNSFWLVGSGTWQAIWDQASRVPIGFGTESDAVREPGQDIAVRIERSGVIPTELLRRFCAELVILNPPTESDYRRGAEIYELARMAHDLGVTLDYADAVRQERGARWLEETFARLLRLARRQGKTILPSDPLIVPEPPQAPSSKTDVPDDHESDIPF